MGVETGVNTQHYTGVINKNLNLNRPDWGGRVGGVERGVFTEIPGSSTKPKLRGEPPRLGWVCEVERGVNTQTPGSSAKRRGGRWGRGWTGVQISGSSTKPKLRGESPRQG